MGSAYSRGGDVIYRVLLVIIKYLLGVEGGGKLVRGWRFWW